MKLNDDDMFQETLFQMASSVNDEEYLELKLLNEVHLPKAL